MSEIYMFGDSASQGIVLDENNQYRVSRSGCIRLLKHLGYPIRNYAVHGHTVLDGLRDFRNLPLEPGSSCVIQFGGNDCDLDWDAVSNDPAHFHDGKVPLADFRKVLGTFVEEARQRQLEPILIPCLPLIGSRYFQWVSRNRNSENILHYLEDDPESICRWQERYAIAVWDMLVLGHRMLNGIFLKQVVRLVPSRVTILKAHLFVKSISKQQFYGQHPPREKALKHIWPNIKMILLPFNSGTISAQ